MDTLQHSSFILPLTAFEIWRDCGSTPQPVAEGLPTRLGCVVSAAHHPMVRSLVSAAHHPMVRSVVSAAHHPMGRSVVWVYVGQNKK